MILPSSPARTRTRVVTSPRTFFNIFINLRRAWQVELEGLKAFYQKVQSDKASFNEYNNLTTRRILLYSTSSIQADVD